MSQRSAVCWSIEHGAVDVAIECRTKLTIIIPVYNERATIVQVIERLKQSGCGAYEWIFVDDGSTDGSTQLLRDHVPTHQTLIVLPSNQGKSAAVRTGIEHATGEWIIVQDADMEYNPIEIPRLLDAAESSTTYPIAVYGRRPSYWHDPSRWVFAMGVLGIDLAILIVYRRWVRDHATCYKLVPRRLLQSFDLQSTGFEGCVEITSKLMLSQTRIMQIPIGYVPRKMSEGKKLTLGYGWTALHSVWRFRK